MNRGARLTTPRCPSLGLWLCVNGPELPLWQRCRMLTHLLRCTACRAIVRDLQILSEIVQLEEEAGRGAVEDPEGHDQIASHRDFQQRLQAHEHLLLQHNRSAITRRWLPAAAMIPVIVMASLLSRTYIGVLHADAVLRSTVAEEAAQPSNTTRVYQLSLTMAGASESALPTRVLLFRGPPLQGSSAPPLGTDVPSAAVNALSTFPFDWQRPLSAKQLALWRAAQRTVGEDVTQTVEGIVLRMRVVGNQLRMVEFLVNADTYHPLRLTLHLDGGDKVDIEEVSGSVDPLEIHVWPRPEAVPAPHTDTLDVAELDARLALQRVGVSSPRNIRVSRTSDAVRVEGRLTSPSIRRALQARLADIPHVRASLHVQNSPDASVQPIGLGMSRWLERAFADDARRQRFVADLDHRLSAVADHLAALEDLAHRYPERTSSYLSPPLQLKLETLVAEEWRTLRVELLALRQNLTALVGPTSRRAIAGFALTDWRTVGNRARAHAQALDARLRDAIRRDDVIDRAGVTTAFDELLASLDGRR